MGNQLGNEVAAVAAWPCWTVLGFIPLRWALTALATAVKTSRHQGLVVQIVEMLKGARGIWVMWVTRPYQVQAAFVFSPVKATLW